jgi:acetolactate synthase-1/2/3 large subunit
MKKLGAYLIEALHAQGVTHVFGIPGVHNLELYRGLAQSPIRHVAARHEQGLGFMADGYARLSGEVGVCFTITGPGLTNILTSMGQAYGDSIPMLVVSSQNKRGEAGSGRGFLHELPDQTALARGVSALCFVIHHADELPAALEAAFALFASDRPRPVYIEIGLDVLASDASHLNLPRPIFTRRTPEATHLTAAATLLKSAQRPVVIAGGGARGAVAELTWLIEQLDAPCVMTTNARGLLGCTHPLAVPMSPSLASVRRLIQDADVVLAVGTEFGPTDFDMYSVSDFPTPKNLIRVDVDAQQLTRSVMPTVSLCGDAVETLRLLMAADVGPQHVSAGSKRASATCTDAFAELSGAMQTQVMLLNRMRDTLPNALMVGDSTQLVYAGNLGFNAATPGSWFNSATGYGTLGYALPASTGAGLAAPDRPVLCLVGDGGLQFSLGEFAVLRDVNAWTAVIIWNNHGYGEIKTSMEAVGIDPEGVDVREPDFSCIAKAYGYAHQTIRSVDALIHALKAFGAKRQVVLLEIIPEAFA